MTKNKRWRDEWQQEYRDKVAHDVKELRKHGDAWRELAKNLLENEKVNYNYISSLWEGRTLGMDVAKNLIENGKLYLLINNLSKFKWLNKEIALKIIFDDEEHIQLRSKETFITFVKNLSSFKWLDSDIAYTILEIIHSNLLYHWARYEDVAKNLDSFEKLDNEVARKLMRDKKACDYVVTNLGKFELYNGDAISLIRDWHGVHVAKDLDKFIGVDYNRIAEELIKQKEWYIIERNLSKFKWLKKEIARILLDKWYYNSVLENIDKFEWLTLEEIRKKLVDLWHWHYVAEHPEKFWLKKEK